jgi:hypothetical protein
VSEPSIAADVYHHAVGATRYLLWGRRLFRAGVPSPAVAGSPPVAYDEPAQSWTHGKAMTGESMDNQRKSAIDRSLVIARESKV